MQVTSHTTVAAPIETVWDKLSDHAGMSQWGPGIRIASPGPGPDIVEEVVTFEAPHVLGYKALSGTPFPGYAGEVRLTEAGQGAPGGLCRVLLHLLARASKKQN